METTRCNLPLHLADPHYEAVPFAEFCRQWLLQAQPKLKPSSYAKYSTQIQKHIIPFLGSFCASSMTDGDLKAFSAFLRDDLGLAAKTEKDILVLLASILKYAGEFDPRYLRLRPEYPRIIHQEMRVLSRTEQKILIEYLVKDMDTVKFGILLALLTGMRIGEVCALKWGSISLRDEKIQVRTTLLRVQQSGDTDACKTHVVTTLPKSEKSIRSIPMSVLAVGLCRRMQCQDPQAYILTGTTDYMEPRTLQYRLRRYREECHLEGVHFHTLRHTFATRCMEVGVETKVLSDILGHSNISITLDRYVHASFDIKRENIQKLQAVGM